MVVLGGTYNKLRGGGDYSIRSISLQNVVKHNKTLKFKCSTLTSGLSKIGSPSSWLCVILAGIILNFNFYQLFLHISKIAPTKFWSCTTMAMAMAMAMGGRGRGFSDFVVYVHPKTTIFYVAKPIPSSFSYLRKEK